MTATLAASAAQVKQLLAGMDGWDDSHWFPFYEEVHSALFREQKNDKIIANCYLGKLYGAGIVDVKDLERLVRTGTQLIEIVHTPSAVAFFKKTYNIQDANRPPPPPPATVSLKVNYDRVTKTLELERNEVTMRFIESVVRFNYDIPLAALKFYIGTNTTPLVQESQLQGATGTISIYVVRLQIGFSKVKSMSDAEYVRKRHGY
jgi:hypothetical protein